MAKHLRPEKIDDFAAWASWIRAAYDRAKKGKGDRRPIERPSGAIRHHAYRYFRLLERNGIMKELEAFVTERDGQRWARSRGQGVVWVLRLLEMDPEDELIDSGERSRIVGELTAAYRLGVRGAWILPFLYDAGPTARLKKLSSAKRVPEWVTKYTTVSKGRGQGGNERQAPGSNTV